MQRYSFAEEERAGTTFANEMRIHASESFTIIQDLDPTNDSQSWQGKNVNLFCCVLSFFFVFRWQYTVVPLLISS